MHSVPKTNAYSNRYSEPLSHQSNCDKQYADVVRSDASFTGHQSAIPVITSTFRGKSFPASQTSVSHGDFEHDGQRRWGNQPYRRRGSARRTRNKFQSLNSMSDRQMRNYAYPNRRNVEFQSWNTVQENDFPRRTQNRPTFDPGSIQLSRNYQYFETRAKTLSDVSESNSRYPSMNRENHFTSVNNHGLPRIIPDEDQDFDLSDFVRKRTRRFFVGGFKPGITEGNITSYVGCRGPKVTKVSRFRYRDKPVIIRLNVKDDENVRFLDDPYFWPNGVVCRPWVSQAKYNARDFEETHVRASPVTLTRSDSYVFERNYVFNRNRIEALHNLAVHE